MPQMMSNIRSHNEERAEMSLSQLAFSLLGDSNKFSVEKLDTNYVLVNFCHELVKNFMRDLSLVPDKQQTLSTIKQTQEVILIAAHMQTVIADMSNERWQSYIPGAIKYTKEDKQHDFIYLCFLHRNVTIEVKEILQQMRTLLLVDNFSYNE